MREANRLERRSKNWVPKSKYYIVPEGDKTEIQYFDGIIRNSKYLGISSLIEIIPIINSEDEQGQSHPLKKINNFKKDLDNGKFYFDSRIDKVCIVVDRDKQNFKEFQYSEVIQKCEDYKFDLYISNPCFEIFLLMHSDKFCELDEIKLLNNPKIGKKKKYTEKMLSDIFRCSKTNLNFNLFLPNIDLAIETEKKYSEDIKLLKDCIGSNVGILINELKNKKND